MSKKIKNACLALTVAALVGVSASFAGCTVKSKHPEIKITIEFNSVSYEIEYKLYRNMYPQTVQHFIELTDDGFYNDTIIHDYKSSDWVGGAYGYDDNEQTGYVASSKSMSEYLDNHSKEAEYHEKMTEGLKNGTFTSSVFTKSIYDDKNKEIVSNDDALPTVIGEFSENGHKIEGDKGLTASYGTLKMVYYQKAGNKKVYVKDSFNDILYRDYHNNCATSLFSMQVSNSTIYGANKYCVFGQLSDDAQKDVLESLFDAISDYSTGKDGFTSTVATQVDKLDKFAEDSGRGMDQSFTMTSMPLIIRSIQVTKY